MKTAAYTICKNEINRVEQWVYYTKDFDYRVILDTGSTDGTYEAFKKVPNIIIDQLIMPQEEFRFDIPRKKNLEMVPSDVDWALSPDVDEYFSINVLEEMEKTIKENPKVTNIACTRLDIYAKEVFVGPPKHIGTNKIHKRNLYTWKQPIYEHLSYTGKGSEVEIFNNKIYLVHNQEINKPRGKHYLTLMQREYKNNPRNTWNNWFLANEYFIQQDLENFVQVGLDYVTYDDGVEGKYFEVLNMLRKIAHSNNVEISIRNKIINRIATLFN
jgi:hypothetical protein